MSMTLLSHLNDWGLVDEDQDIRGWPVKDASGSTLGTVRDFVVDTEAERVNSVVLDDGKKLSVQDVDPDFDQHVVRLHGSGLASGTARNATMSAATGRAPMTDTATGSGREMSQTDSMAGRTMGTTGREMRSEGRLEGDQEIPIAEEELQVGKREVEKGWARVRSRVVSKPVHEEVTLREEHVDVERHKVNRPATDADFQERTIEAREMAEEPVVKKEARVVEEVGLHKDMQQHTETINDTVRHTEVDVQNPQEVGRTTGTRAFDTYDRDFRNDYQTRYANLGGRYEDYQPAYRYGYDLANNPRYKGRDWNSIEPDVRRDWDSRYGSSGQSTWDKMKDSVRYGWDKVTGQTS